MESMTQNQLKKETHKLGYLLEDTLDKFRNELILERNCKDPGAILNILLNAVALSAGGLIRAFVISDEHKLLAVDRFANTVKSCVLADIVVVEDTEND